MLLSFVIVKKKKKKKKEYISHNQCCKNRQVLVGMKSTLYSAIHVIINSKNVKKVNPKYEAQKLENLQVEKDRREIHGCHSTGLASLRNSLYTLQCNHQLSYKVQQARLDLQIYSMISEKIGQGDEPHPCFSSKTSHAVRVIGILVIMRRRKPSLLT